MAGTTAFQEETLWQRNNRPRVVNLFTAFGYLKSDDEDQQVIHQVAKALRSSGTFALDVANRDRVIRRYRENFWR